VTNIGVNSLNNIANLPNQVISSPTYGFGSPGIVLQKTAGAISLISAGHNLEYKYFM
jgi:hypothetical protein